MALQTKFEATLFSRLNQMKDLKLLLHLLPSALLSYTCTPCYMETRVILEEHLALIKALLPPYLPPHTHVIPPSSWLFSHAVVLSSICLSTWLLHPYDFLPTHSLSLSPPISRYPPRTPPVFHLLPPASFSLSCSTLPCSVWDAASWSMWAASGSLLDPVPEFRMDRRLSSRITPGEAAVCIECVC